MSKFKRIGMLGALMSTLLACSAGGKGDVRDDMVQMIAREAKAANVDLDIQVYPGASLFKAEQQWNALVNGQLDITLFPLDYASGQVRVFSATLMPGLVRSYERAKRLNDSQFMKDIRGHIEKAGAIVLSDAWFGGCSRAWTPCLRRTRHRTARSRRPSRCARGCPS